MLIPLIDKHQQILYGNCVTSGKVLRLWKDKYQQILYGNP